MPSESIPRGFRCHSRWKWCGRVPVVRLATRSPSPTASIARRFCRGSHSVGSRPCLSLRRRPASSAGGRCTGARSGSGHGTKSVTARPPAVVGVCSRSTASWSRRSWSCSRGALVARASVRTTRHESLVVLTGSNLRNPLAPQPVVSRRLAGPRSRRRVEWWTHQRRRAPSRSG